MIKLFSVLSLLLFVSFTCGQDKKPPDKNESNQDIEVGGGCEGCEAVFESFVPFESLSHIDTLPDYNESGPKMEISGIIYMPDGTTPAEGIVMYLYHTDQNGYYSTKGSETGWGKRHGYIRGWLKTNEKGEYKFYTLRPAPYPNATFPAHIHPTIKEPGKTPYWIDDFVFEDDKFVDETYRRKAENRGGNGIIRLVKNENGIYTAKRDIVLGKNIPGYK